MSHLLQARHFSRHFRDISLNLNKGFAGRRYK